MEGAVSGTVYKFKTPYPGLIGPGGVRLAAQPLLCRAAAMVRAATAARTTFAAVGVQEDPWPAPGWPSLERATLIPMYLL